MKNLYRITDKNGVTLCSHVAKSKKEAIAIARNLGYKGTLKAELMPHYVVDMENISPWLT